MTVSFGASTYTAAEGGTATVTVTLSADPERTVEVPITTTNQGGAVAADYSGVPASVTFATGETEQTITFTAAQDTVDDDGESVKLGFGTTLPARVSEVSPSETTVSIRDDDDPQVTVSFGASTYTAAEGSTATVTVTLSADPERTVEVQITTTNQGGASAADYSGVPATVTFNAGETSQPDHLRGDPGHGGRRRREREAGLRRAAHRGEGEALPDETTVSIRDDDDPQVTVSFGAATYTGDRRAARLTVTVELSADPERTVAVPVTKTEPGRGDRRRLLGGARQRHVRRRPDTSQDLRPSQRRQDTEDDDGRERAAGLRRRCPPG